MAIVAGVDFGTLSVRVTLVDSKKGPIGTASVSYPLHRRREDPNYATQSHADQMAALTAATRDALRATGVHGSRRCRHRARHHRLERHSGRRRAWSRSANTTSGAIIAPLPRPRRLPAKPTQLGFEGIEWCGGVYSHEWGFAKLLHWLRHNPKQREKFVTALEHCDMVAATLCGRRPR